ncbi:HlyD family secretion protein [Hydrogenispora ethanolica]|jgi:HlyD family secretion protein|uniref:HlyD family secretion protein n=1 Tax=Hydrogenispora ethanolica TaxID=1082276 RepID=A0A4R1R9B3_HYDET|nr:efflux RND transporter periplasmic adaptor subunit [Hydrogenispora ethanolica]TCL62294.1 HlyD family secretion protein [Hydrogenispora ethanolica]
MNKRFLAVIGIFVILAGLTIYKLWDKKAEGITATGTIEITKTDITPKVGGYLAELAVDSGTEVQAGQTVARIDRPDLEAQLLRDEAALDKAELQLEDLEKGARAQERKAASANVASARSVYQKAKADFVRYHALYQQGAISQRDLDVARSAMEVAESSLQSAEMQLSLAAEGNRPDTIAAQRKEVLRNQAIVAASQVALKDAIVTVPLSGVVLSKNYEQGEFVNAGSAIATVGDLKDCWVRIYVASTQLGLIKIGQTCDVTIDSFPGRVFRGVIREINQSAEYTPRQSITERERANLVFGVKVKLDNSEGILKPGMPADVVLK